MTKIRSGRRNPAFTRFLRAERGSVAIVFAAALTAISLVVGGTVDFARIVRARDALRQVADSAALAAAQTAARQYAAGTPSWKNAGVSAGQSTFDAQTHSLAGATVGAPTISIAQNGLQVTAQLSYSGTFPLTFARLLGISNANLSSSVTATSTLPQYVDVHIVVDVSQSMGIGATAADQQTLQSAIGCTLACHITDNVGDTDNLAQARASGAILRIDAVKSAIVSALQGLNGAALGAQARFAIYTMSNNLTQVYPLQSGLAGAIAAIQGIDLTTANQQGGTNVTYSLQQLSSLLPAAGTGLNPGSPRGVVMLLTDGVQDSTYELYANGSSPPFDPSTKDPNFVLYAPYADFSGFVGDPVLQGIDPLQCSTIKSKGYTMLTLYASYVVPAVYRSADQPRLDFITNSILPSLSGNMAACASGTNYAFVASDPVDLTAAVTNMMKSISLGGLALTH
ncbi:MAG: VWA domain-containing protein [Hyphomicrobiales bacterium]|nr:VWA domain-containing protein [Hyphomicrobiales bacterium]